MAFHRRRSMGNRITNRKMIGVRTAHGNQSRILGRIVIVQGPPVSRTSFAPRTKATIPQPKKERAQPFNKEPNSEVKLLCPFVCLVTTHARPETGLVLGDSRKTPGDRSAQLLWDRPCRFWDEERSKPRERNRSFGVNCGGDSSCNGLQFCN